MTSPARSVATWANVTALLFLAPCSSPAHIAVPHGSKPVSYDGITTDIPQTWSGFQRAKTSAPFAVLVSSWVCLIFGGPDIVVPVGGETSTSINGVQAAVSKASYSSGYVDYGNGVDIPQYVSYEVVRFHRMGVWLRASAPGKQSAGVLGVVDRVVATVRAS